MFVFALDDFMRGSCTFRVCGAVHAISTESLGSHRLDRFVQRGAWSEQVFCSPPSMMRVIITFPFAETSWTSAFTGS